MSEDNGLRHGPYWVDPRCWCEYVDVGIGMMQVSLHPACDVCNEPEPMSAEEEEMMPRDCRCFCHDYPGSLCHVSPACCREAYDDAWNTIRALTCPFCGYYRDTPNHEYGCIMGREDFGSQT